MYPDVNNRDYYKKFIADCDSNIKILTEKLEEIENSIKETKEFLNENIDRIKNANVDIDKYPSEWNGIYDKENKLFNRVDNLLKRANADNGFILKQLYKYCTLLKQKHEVAYNIELNKRGKRLNYNQWQTHVSNYYYTVHKCVLQGYTYAFGYGIGDLLITVHQNKNNSKVLNYVATQRVKKRLLEQGKRLWNEQEAAEYEERNEEYDGVDYRVFKSDRVIYKINIYNTSCIRNNKKRFKTGHYVNRKMWKYTYDEIAELVKTKEDIYYMPCNLRTKLMVLLKNFPAEHIKFHSYTDEKYHDRTYYRKNRQRL